MTADRHTKRSRFLPHPFRSRDPHREVQEDLSHQDVRCCSQCAQGLPAVATLEPLVASDPADAAEDRQNDAGDRDGDEADGPEPDPFPAIEG